MTTKTEVDPVEQNPRLIGYVLYHIVLKAVLAGGLLYLIYWYGVYRGSRFLPASFFYLGVIVGFLLINEAITYARVWRGAWREDP